MASAVAWPSPGDYSAAVQNPHHCFTDPTLARGHVTTNRLGLPVGASGNFAVVYQVQNGSKGFAVRCFIRPVTDHQHRYEVLSQHLQGFWLPTLVDFAYLPQGIRVGGHRYPVVRMEWIKGRQLHQYVEAHLQQGEVLRHLAAQWRGVLAGLRGAYIAHGDLQHGNILIDDRGQIRLVDYDGLFLPALQRHIPGEVGHPNYQHPQRLRQGYYGEHGDAFAALVIYLSLLALSTDPRLWTFHTGENLIFKADDFAQPARTPVWHQLQASRDALVQQLTAALAQACQGSVDAVPPLETLLQNFAGNPGPVVQPSAPSLAPSAVPGSAPPVPTQPAMVMCPRCQRENYATEIYCQRCAHQLCGNRWCPHCTQSIPVLARACPACGGRL